MNLLINADARKIPLADQSIHCVVTSPPYYGLRDYGISDQIGLEQTPEEYVASMVQVFREVWRVLRDDGTLWLNIGDSYAGSGGAGGDYNVGGLKEGQPKYPGRHLGNLKPKDLIGIPWMVAFALRADGWYLRSDIIWHKPDPMPESVKDRPTKAHEYIFLLSKSASYYYDAEAVREPNSETSHTGGQYRNECKYTAIGHGSSTSQMRVGVPIPRNGRNKRDVWTVTTKPYAGTHYAVFPPDLIEPCILAGTSEKGVCPKCGAPWERVVEKGLTAHDGETDTRYQKGMTANRLALLRQAARERGGEYANESKTTGWQPTCDCGIKETVPATVLDPFVGSGTTCMVARKHGRNGIGLDLSWKYLNTNARERLVYGGFVPVADGINQLTIGV